MSSPANTFDTRHVASSEFSALDRWLRQRLFARIGAMTGGTLTIHDAFGSQRLGVSNTPDALDVCLRVHSPEFYRAIASHGSVGAGESYMAGAWDCDDLVGLVRLLVRNRDLLDGMEGGLAKLGGLAMKALHSLRRNTRVGSRKNISAHYDLGNDLFRLFLDENMMYSSAIFTETEDTLETASRRKLDRICQKLQLTPSDHLIEIGTGWGGMAIHAARHYGCRVTTTTISKEQHALASERVSEAGLSDRITVLLQDYRDLSGHYDKLVSIEMIEAIGPQYLDTYFSKCASLLKPDGLALIQAITIEGHRYQQALRSVDFIQQHIFPGSFIPCVSVTTQAAAHSGELRLLNLEDIGPSYARTLNHWRQRFFANVDQVRALGYDECFVRMWEFYLCYCEGGFIERSISDAHLLFARSGNRREQYLPGMAA